MYYIHEQVVGTWEWSKDTPVSIMCDGSHCHTAKDLFYINNLTNGTTCYSIVWSAYFKHSTHKFHLE